jgi:DNA-directed RNA polymerase specialized sigma24 family protein
MNSSPTTFPKTRWTLVQKVRSGSAQERASALEDLCKAYGFPLYAFARKGGHSQEEAEDAVQDFMIGVIHTDLFASAEESHGHLRTLLLTYFTRNIKNRQARHLRQKRGGTVPHVPLPFPDPEGRYQQDIASLDLPPDLIFHHQWAESLIQRALNRLKQLFVDQGQTERFNVLRTFLPLNDGDDETGTEAAAVAMDLTPGAFRMTLHRTRQRFRDLILDEISQTIGSDDPVLIQDELRALFQILTR